MLPSRQTTEPSAREIQLTVHSLEMAVAMMRQGVENIVLLLDFKNMSSSKALSVSIARQLLHILQNHYPERLGKAIVINGIPVWKARLIPVPTFVWFFFKLIGAFIDPYTREKLKFNENPRNYVPPEQLYDLFDGDCQFEYDHNVYFPEYIRLASEKRNKYFARRRAAGGGIGQSEWDLRGTDPLPEQNV